MTLITRRLALFVAAAIPFILVPASLAWSVGPMARVGARWCNVVFALLAVATDPASRAPNDATEAVAPTEPAADVTLPQDNEPVASASRFRAADSRGLPVASRRTEPGDTSPSITAAKRAIARRARPSVFVGPESIQRALPVAGRPTSEWTNRTLQHPAGLLIQSPGALTGVIEPGDILVEAEGQPLGSFEQLVVTVKQAYERRAKRLSGRLYRKGDMVALTVEPGW